jgi:hypothetical protein
MGPPAKIMQARTIPMATGAMAPAPGSLTAAIPTVNTRKKVPINSTMYFFIYIASLLVQTQERQVIG